MMREIHAFCEKCVIDIHWLFCVLIGWHHGCFIGLVLFHRVAAFGLHCACAPCGNLLASMHRVCFGFTRLWRVLPVCCSCGVCHRRTGALCLWRVCPKMSENTVSTVSTVATPVKFSGRYAGVSTDVYVFLTHHCGISETVAVKVANDAASSIGRVMVGVSSEVSFGRMSKDTLATIKETASRKGVSVNEFPLQCAYLAEKVRKFSFDNKVKIGAVGLPENLAVYLGDLAK
jgi:hypothetical protein